MTLGEIKDTYGILVPETKKFYCLPNSSYKMPNFGPGAKTGDVIGVLLEFNEDGKGQLTFFKNGASMGKVYSDIKEGDYTPCISMSNGKNTILLRTGKMPSEPYEMLDGCQNQEGGGG